MKSSKILIATIWKNPLDLSKIESLIKAGANILRVKFGHISVEESIAVIKEVQNFIKQNGYKAEVLLDMPEGKLRLGAFKNTKEEVKINTDYNLRTSETTGTVNEYIPIQASNFKDLFTEGDSVWVGDGELQFVVKKIISDKEAIINFTYSGMLNQYRGVFSKKFFNNFNHLDPVIETLRVLGDVRPENIAISFVNNAQCIVKVREEIQNIFGDSWKPKIMAKIESQAGLDNLEEIAKVSDMLVVARGDLALTTDFDKLILNQKNMCQLGQKLGIPVIVATQILDSCINSAVPSRADLGDITNIILDGADGMWFSQATAHNPNPGYVIQVAKRIIESVENNNI